MRAERSIQIDALILRQPIVGIAGEDRLDGQAVFVRTTRINAVPVEAWIDLPGVPVGQDLVGEEHCHARSLTVVLHEEWIGREFEGFAAVRLYGNGLKYPMSGGFGKPVLLLCLAHTPVGPGKSLGLQSAAQQRGHLLIGTGPQQSIPVRVEAAQSTYPTLP